MLSPDPDEREKGISRLSGENPWSVPFIQGSTYMRSCVFRSQLQFAAQCTSRNADAFPDPSLFALPSP